MTKKHRILAVDDHPVNLHICKEILSDEFDLMTVSDGESAIAAVAEFEPDIILLDVMMPGMDGFEVLRRIRASSDPWVKIIMVSAKVQTSDRVDAYKVGADDYVCKPFDEDELLAKIRVHLRLRHVEEVDGIKQCLLEMLQHGNRTPMTTILSNTDLLLMMGNKLPETEQARLLEATARATRRLYDWLAVGEKLMEFKSGQAYLCPCDFVVHETVQDIIDRLDHRRSIRATMVTTDVPTEIAVKFTPEHFDLIIEHLLISACAYSEDDNSVQLVIQQNDTRALTIRVDYEGHSIDDKHLPTLFEAFGNPDEVMHNLGDGMGLALVHDIVKLHRGMISAQRTSDGKMQILARLPVEKTDDAPSSVMIAPVWSDVSADSQSSPISPR